MNFIEQDPCAGHARSTAMARVCPKCDKPLVIAQFENLEIDFCSTCHGIWLDSGELESVMKDRGVENQDPLLRNIENPKHVAKHHRYLCPRCDQKLEEITLQRNERDLKLDRCSIGHGFWFDREELKILLDHFQDKEEPSMIVDQMKHFLGGSIVFKRKEK